MLPRACMLHGSMMLLCQYLHDSSAMCPCSVAVACRSAHSMVEPTHDKEPLLQPCTSLSCSLSSASLPCSHSRVWLATSLNLPVLHSVSLKSCNSNSGISLSCSAQLILSHSLPALPHQTLAGAVASTSFPRLLPCIPGEMMLDCPCRMHENRHCQPLRRENRDGHALQHISLLCPSHGVTSPPHDASLLPGSQGEGLLNDNKRKYQGTGWSGGDKERNKRLRQIDQFPTQAPGMCPCHVFLLLLLLLRLLELDRLLFP